MPTHVVAFRLALLAAAPQLAWHAVSAAPENSETAPRFPLAEMTIADLGRKMQNHELTSHALVQAYLDRIAAIDRSGPALKAVIELNPEALAIADQSTPSEQVEKCADRCTVSRS